MSKIKYIILSIHQYAKKVSKEENGKSYILAFIDIIYCGFVYGASPQNYYKFDFYKITSTQRKTYVTNRISEKLIKKYNEDAYREIFEDKAQFAAAFGDFFKRKWLKYPQCTQNDYIEFCKEIDGMICKPLDGAQGRGIIVYKDTIPNYEQLKERLMGGGFILEAFIKQHDELAAFYDKAVNCIRIITIYKDNIMHPIVANITFGSDFEIANASYGGITAEIDIKNGKIVSDGGQYGHKLYKQHPYSSKTFVNYVIPYWSETIKMLSKACQKVPQVGYIGWDVAITNDGPVIIEGNTSPGYTYFQIPQLLKGGVGTKPYYQPYL